MFRSLRHPNYRLWFFGYSISLVGTWMQTMAQQVLVYRLTGSGAALGLINFIGLIPLLPLTLWGGSIADRFPKRKVILVVQCVLLIQALLLAIFTWSGIIEVWHVYLLAFIMGAATAVDLPTRQAFTVEMVEGKEDLANAIGLNSAIFNGARALGPAFAGIVVAATGEGTAFFINALTFLSVIASLLLMKNLPPVRSRAQGSSVTQHTLEGLHYVRKNRTLLILISLVAVSAFLSMPYNTVMPVFAETVLKDSARPVVESICNTAVTGLHCQAPEALPLGFLLTMVGLGAVVGAFIVAGLPYNSRRGLFLTIGNIAFPVALILFSLSKDFVFSLSILFFVGISFVLQNALANTLVQMTCPDELRGRVMSVYTLVFQGMMRIGAFQAGVMTDWISAPLSVGIGAAASLIYGLFIAIRTPSVRRL